MAWSATAGFAALLAVAALAVAAPAGEAPATSCAPEGCGPSCDGHPATLTGSERGDRLVGTARSDVIDAGRGDDRVKGMGGSDIVCGGPGDDLLLGNAGSDGWTGTGRPVLVGAGLHGGRGHDLIGGGSGHDLLLGQGGADVLAGREGHDRCKGGRPTAGSLPRDDVAATSCEETLGARSG